MKISFLSKKHCFSAIEQLLLCKQSYVNENRMYSYCSFQDFYAKIGVMLKLFSGYL